MLFDSYCKLVNMLSMARQSSQVSSLQWWPPIWFIWCYNVKSLIFWVVEFLRKWGIRRKTTFWTKMKKKKVLKSPPKTKLINIYWIQLDKCQKRCPIKQNKPCFTYNHDNSLWLILNPQTPVRTPVISLRDLDDPDWFTVVYHFPAKLTQCCTCCGLV